MLAIQPSRTASTGVVQGEAASPNANPAATGASGAGTLLVQRRNKGWDQTGNLTVNAAEQTTQASQHNQGANDASAKGQAALPRFLLAVKAC